MNNIDSLAAMEKTLQLVLKEHSENEAIIKAFGPILLCEEKLLQEHALKKAANTVEQKDAKSPLLDKSALAFCTKKITIFSQALLTTMEDSLPQLASEIQTLRDSLKATAIRDLCKDFLAGKNNQKELMSLYIENTIFPYIQKNTKTKSKTDDGKNRIADIEKKEKFQSLLELFVTRISHLFLSRAARSLPKAKDNINLNTCPYCGSRPSLSIVHEKEGHKDLLCSSCGRTWRFKRTTCPNCLVEEQKNLHLVYQEKNTQERAVHCVKCNHYLLEVDIREKDVTIECVNMLALGLTYLDAIMQENKAIAFN